MEAISIILENIGFIITTALTLTGIVVAMVKIWQKWSLKMAEYKESTVKQISAMNQRADDNEKTIKEHHDVTILQIEELKVERERIVERVNNRIQRLEQKHEDDVTYLQEAIEKAIARIHTENREDHNKIFDKLDNLTKEVVAVCSTFAEFKENQKTITPRKK